MQMSELAYIKATEMLEWITTNPDRHMGEIADAVSMLKASAHIIVQKMVSARVLEFTTRKHRGGKRFYYRATGKPLPNRTPVKRTRVSMTQVQPAIDAIPEDQFISMPSFLRALTPVVTTERHGVAFYGHTSEQHQRQSAIIRKERSIALRGAVSTGESRL